MISYLNVEPKYRNNDLGTTLVHHALKAARRRGHSAVYVHAIQLDGPHPKEFYQKLGFEVVCTDKHGDPFLVCSTTSTTHKHETIQPSHPSQAHPVVRR